MVYLRDLAQGLVQDAPQTPGGSTEGAQKLQEQARGTEKEYDDVTGKVRIRVTVRKREQEKKYVGFFLYVTNLHRKQI